MLTGCAVNRMFQPQVHEVRRGETLSSIAASYGLNWHNLARWNHIRPPYIIEIGQRLTLDPFPPLDYSHIGRRSPPRQANTAPPPRSRVTPIPRERGPSVTRLPAEPPSVSRAEPAPLPKTATTPAPTPESAPEPIIEPALTSPEGWRWPLATSVLRTHDAERTRQGIDLYGVAGTPIYAARAGEVVYSGTGLQGFGKLVIIKHGAHYLSAYGFNRNVKVNEGDEIAAGQHIADMGIGPQSRAALHFEIRRDGKPIDPATVLPEL